MFDEIEQQISKLPESLQDKARYFVESLPQRYEVSSITDLTAARISTGLKPACEVVFQSRPMANSHRKGKYIHAGAIERAIIEA